MSGTSAPDFAILVLLSSIIKFNRLSKSRESRLTVCRKVRDATDSVALNFDIWAEHLSNQGLEATQLDNEELVFG